MAEPSHKLHGKLVDAAPLGLDLAERRLLVAADLKFQNAVLEAIEAGTEHIESMRREYKIRIHTGGVPPMTDAFRRELAKIKAPPTRLPAWSWLKRQSG